MAVEAFAALNRMLEASLRSKQMEMSQSLAMLQMAEQAEAREEDVSYRERVRGEDVAYREAQRIHAEDMASRTMQIREDQLLISQSLHDMKEQQFQMTEFQAHIENYDNINKEMSLITAKGIWESLNLSVDISLPDEQKEEWSKDVKKILTSKRKGGYGFSDLQADNIMGAIFASSVGDAQPTLNLFDKIERALRKSQNQQRLSQDESLLLAGFSKIGLFAPEEIKDEELGDIRTGRLIPSPEWDQAFTNIRVLISNREKIVEERKEFSAKDYDIQRDIESVKAEQLEEMIGSLQYLTSAEAFKQSLDEFARSAEAEQKGITVPELNLMKKKDAAADAIDQYNQAEDEKANALYEETMLKRQSDAFGFDADDKLEALRRIQEDQQAIMDSTSINYEQAKYDADIAAGVLHLEKVGVPKDDQYDSGYSQEQIESVLEMLEEQVESKYTGRRSSATQLIREGKWLGIQ